MFKYEIELVTSADVAEFVNLTSQLDGKIQVRDGEGHCVNAKSLLGMIYALEFSTMECVADEDIYTKIAKFCKE